MSEPDSPQKPSAPSAPAGWYPDPASGEQRYWDGDKWTNITPPPARSEMAPATPGAVTHRPLSGPAVAGFILSIVALLGTSLNNYGITVILLLAFIFSGVGMNATVNGKSGRGLGIAGLIISIFAVLAVIGMTALHSKN